MIYLGYATLVYFVLTIFAVIYALMTETLFENETRLQLGVMIAFTWPLILWGYLTNE